MGEGAFVLVKFAHAHGSHRHMQWHAARVDRLQQARGGRVTESLGLYDSLQQFSTLLNSYLVNILNSVL